MAKNILWQNTGNLPKHIGIIMDGNGRWASKRGLPRTMGHKEGAKTFQKIAQHCHDIGIRYLTVYAFSTENWNRPQNEVDAIMNLLRDYLAEVDGHKDENIKTVFIGDKTPLAEDIKEKIIAVEQQTAKNTGMTVNIALNYGGRAELTEAIKQIAILTLDGKISPNEITEQTVSDMLYTRYQPDPDLIIRPSGELRTSNFMIWQAAYSEYVFMDILWPDFKETDLDDAICEFTKRNRRFGGLG
ncbi:MAG: isoprenyl transferase [Oscillospiraceae bacterium]